MLFPINGVLDILEAFEPHEAISQVGRSEAGDFALSMLFHSTSDVIGQSAIKNVGSAGDDIDVIVMISLGHR